MNVFSLAIFTFLETLNKEFGDSYKHFKYILGCFVQNSNHKIEELSKCKFECNHHYIPTSAVIFSH